MADELKASPTFPGQELIGSLGRVAEQLGISLQDATKIISQQGNSPIKAFLADLLVADPLRSAGTALQDWTGTPRDLTEEHPYSRLLSGKGMTLRLDPRVLDVAQFAAPVASAGVKGAKLAGKGAKALGPTAANLAEEYMMSTGMMLPVVKNKGGNFLPEGTKALEGLKRQGVAVTPLNETELAERTAQGYTVHDPETGTYSKPDPINNWIDKQLTRYVKNEMATPEDPIRALAERGTLHFDAPQVNPTDALDLKRQEFAAGNNEKWGYGESRLAQNWEDAADAIINKVPAKWYQKQQHNRFDMTDEPGWEWINKVSPDTPLYGVNNSTRPGLNNDLHISTLGFPHLIDELRNATNPASGLPRELLLKPEALARLSVPQAVERVAKINEWRTGNIKQARLADAANTDVHKEYKDTGMRWVKLNKPGQFKAESDAMGHSVRGYEPTEGGGSSGYGLGGYDAIKSGDAEVYSLRDAKNEPHATIEVRPSYQRELTIADMASMTPEEEAQIIALQRAKQPLPKIDVPGSITQIKGKSNRAPNEDYLPYVQDFVKSGKWSDVKDLLNTGLYKTHGSTGLSRDISPEMSGNARQLAYGRARAAGEIQPYMTKAEIETVMKKHAPEDIWSRPGEPMTDADITGPWEPEGGMKRGGPVNLDAMQMAVWGKDVQRKQAGGLAKAIPSNLAKLMKLLTTEAPLQAPQIRKALGQAFTTGSEHSVVGPTHSAPNESGRVGRITTQGKDYAVAPDQFDIQNAVRGKSSIVDFHSHPADSGRAFSISPSSGDFNFAANEYFLGPQSRELKTLIASPADAALRTPTEYSFFATGTPGKAFDRRAREAAVYELQRSGKNTFKDVLDDPRFRDYFESGGHIGDWAEDVAPLALLKLREAQALGRGKLQLSGRPVAASGGTNIELYDLMQPAATEFLRNKGFDKGGPVNLDAMQLAVWGKPVKKAEGGEPTQAEIEAAMLPATVNPNLQRQAAKIKSLGERDLPIMGPLELGAQVLSGLAAIPFAGARGIYEDFSSRKPGNPYSGQAAAKQGGDEVLEAMTYQPRTAPGQDWSQALVHLLEASKLPPYIGHIGAPHVVPGAGRMLMENATAPGDPFFAGPVGRQRGAVKPLGNLNLQPAIAVETLKGPEVQTLDSFLNQSKSMPGVTKEGLKEGLGEAQSIIPSSKMSKSDFEKYVAPSKYEKVKLADAAGDIDEHMMDEAHMEAQERSGEQMAEIGVPRNLQGAFTDLVEQLNTAESGTPVSQITENQPLRNWLDRQGYRTVDHVDEELQDAVNNITQRLYFDMMTEEGDNGLPAFFDVQRLIDYSIPHTYEAVGVTHPSQTGVYRHFPGQPNMVGHFRGALMTEAMEAEGGVKIPPNAFLVEEIQSDSQQNRAMSGHLHQIHATIAKAAIQHALEMGADSVYFPSSIPISEVRSGSEKTQKLFRRVYDTEVMKGAIDPLRKMKGVTVTGVGKVLGDVGDPKFLYHEVKFSPDAKEQILKGKGQLAPGYKQGGPVNLDAMRMAVTNKQLRKRHG